MITVWGRKSSSNVQAVMWCIEELDIPYTRIDAGFTYGIVDSEDYLAMNPNGTVPTIQDEQNPPLWESGAILRYLAGRFADDDFWPSAVVDRARVDQWAEWAKINIAMAFTGPVFWRVARTPVDRQDPVAIANAVAVFEDALTIADFQLQTSLYLAGEKFSLADIQFAHVLFRYYDIPIARKKLNAVEEYYGRIVQRIAYREHVAISYNELTGSPGCC